MSFDISRSIFALLAACIVALLTLPFAVIHRNRPQVAMRTGVGEVTADIGNLDIRPADPALEPNTEIYADPATLRRLADKLAAAQRDNRDNGVSRWINKARNLASDLQSALTGQQPSAPPPLRLRLTDKSSGSAGGGQSGQPGQPGGQNHPNNPLARSPTPRRC